MRNLNFVLLILSGFSFCGEWEPIQNMGCGSKQGISSSGNRVYLVKQCGSDLIFQRSVDEGNTWSAEVTLANNISLYLQDPINSQADTVLVVYFRITAVIQDFLFARYNVSREVGDLYMLRSDDGGANWQGEVPLTSGARAYRLGMDIDADGTVHIAFMNHRPGLFLPDGNFGTWDVHYLRGSPGMPWQEFVLLSGDDSFGYERPAIASNGQQVHLAWMTPRLGLGDCAANDAGALIPACPGTAYMRSDDGGLTWPLSYQELTTGFSQYASRPSLAFVPPASVVIPFDVFYDEPGNTGLDVHATYSGDDGNTWSPNVRLTNGNTDSTHGYAASGSLTLPLAWHDSVSGGPQVLLQESINGGLQWCELEEVSVTTGSNTPLVTKSAGFTHVAWLDGANVRYRRRPNRWPLTECIGNLDGDLDVDMDDLMTQLPTWSTSAGAPFDQDGNGYLNLIDHVILMNQFVPCDCQAAILP
ncbi:MAG: exo-alpha-sialidase [Acidobacteria bacterium]|nr:exo-alpha-sialidase [Acidobacteriota bacterium]